MDLPATQAIDDEDFMPTQQLVTEDEERERVLVATLIINDNQHPIFSGITTIGRQPDTTIVLTDETVSKRHAEIEALSVNKDFFIKDLGSSNRTKINDTKLRANTNYQIKDNDKLNFGKVTATFKIHRPVDDSIVACTPQVNRKEVIPDTPESSMNDSSAMEGDVSTIPETQADEGDSCFRRPQIPVRTSISNEHESPKLVPFTLDDLPSPLSNCKDDNDISGVETQTFSENNENSKKNVDQNRLFNKSSVKKDLSEDLNNQSIEDIETQEFFQTKSDLSFKKSQNTSIHSALTQVLLPSAKEDQSIENAETQLFVPTMSVDHSNLADVSIHSAATQKMEINQPANREIEDLETQPFTRNSISSEKKESANISIYSAPTQIVEINQPENKSIEDLETQPFTRNSISSDKKESANISIYSAATQIVEVNQPENKSIQDLETQPFNCNNINSNQRKSANTSIYSAETQKVVADVSNQCLDDMQTQKYNSNSDLKIKEADVSIYSAATQKLVSENRDIENLETQKFECTRINQEKLTSSLSFSIQDIDTMPFTKNELLLDKKSGDEIQHNDNDLVDSVDITKKSSEDKEEDKSVNVESSKPLAISDKLDESHTTDEINEDMQNEKNLNEKHPKPVSKNLLEKSSKFDNSKSVVESDDEEIFSQNLIENCPFGMLLDDSKSDDDEQPAADFQNDNELEVSKIADSEHNIPSNNQNSSTVAEKSIKDKSTVAENDDSETDEEGVFSSEPSKENKNQTLTKEIVNDSDAETDEEGVFSSELSKEKTNQTLTKEIGNDSDAETDEEGVFSNHLTEEEKEKANINPEGDSKTNEEGVSSCHLFNNSKEIKISSSNRIIDESESEDEGVFSNNHSKNKVNKDAAIADESATIAAGSSSFVSKPTEDVVPSSAEIERSLNKVEEIVQPESPIPESDDDIFNENDEEKITSCATTDKKSVSTSAEEKTDSTDKSSIANSGHSDLDKNDNDNQNIDELAPTQIVETEDISLAPTQVVNKRPVSDFEEERSENVDELAPTQLMETQNLSENTEDRFVRPLQKSRTVAESVIEQAQPCDDMDLAPTQKIVETQDCVESLAPTQKVVETQKCAETLEPTQLVADTQVCSEEMGALQFSESLAPTQMIENELNNVGNNDVTSPKKSLNTSKRELEDEETSSAKKRKTSEDLSKSNEDLNSTVEQNLNEMFEGSEEKSMNTESPIQTQQLENILESSQLEESPVTSLDVSINKPSPTLSNRRSNIRGKNRRRAVMHNKSGVLNETPRSVVNLNDTIEKNLNELFDDSAEDAETHVPEPMLTQQLQNVLNSSQDENSVDNKKEEQEEGRTLSVTRRKSRLSLSMNLNESMKKLSNEQELNSSIKVQSITKNAETIKRSSLNEKSAQKEDYSANLVKDNAISEKVSRANDKDIVYRRGTIGFNPDDLTPVSTFDRIAFLDKFSTSDSQSDGDDTINLRSSPLTSCKIRESSRLKRVDLNSSQSDQDNEKKVNLSPVLSSKKSKVVQQRSAKKRNPFVRLSKLSSPLYRKYVKPAKRAMDYGLIGFTDNLDPVESEELVSAASTDNENALGAKFEQCSLNISKAIDIQSKQLQTASVEPVNGQLPIDSVPSLNDHETPSDTAMDVDENDSDDELPAVNIAGTVNNPVTCSQLAAMSDHDSDTESIISTKIEIPDRWKWYAQKRYDIIYEKYNRKEEKDDESESENNATDDSIVDDREERLAAINKILEQVEATKDVKKRQSNHGSQNYSRNENTVTTRSRKLQTPCSPLPVPYEDSDADSDKTDPALSSDSDSESSGVLSIFPVYKPVSPLKINMAMLAENQEDMDKIVNLKRELDTLRAANREHTLNRTKPKASPLISRRRRKSACNNDTKDVIQCENNADNKKLATAIFGTVDKDGLVFQVSRDSKTTATARTPVTNRTKRIIDGDDDDQSTHQPSAKRTKTSVDRQKFQNPTVVISPLGDKLINLRERQRLNIPNLPSNFKQPQLSVAKKRATRAAKTLDGYVTLSKAVRTDSSDTSVVDSSIVEDKNKSKTRVRSAMPGKKAKVDKSSEQSANSSKESVEEFDFEKPKTRGRGKRNQATDSSVSDKDSSRSEISASDVENKSTRSTRGRLVRQNQSKREESKPKNSVRKNTRNLAAETIDTSSSSKINVETVIKNDKLNNKKDAQSQSSSQSEPVIARSTRTRNNQNSQQSELSNSETLKVAAPRGNKRKAVADKSSLVIKLTDVDSNKETTISDGKSEDDVNVFKLMKEKVNMKSEEPIAAPARKTRTRATKNATVFEESSSEESQEVSEIMKNSVAEDSKTSKSRRGRQLKNNTSYRENTESSDDVFEKPTLRAKRPRLANKAGKNKSSHVSDTDEDSTKPTPRSSRRKHSPTPSPTPPADAALTPSRLSRSSLSPSKRPKVLFTGERSETHRTILKRLGGIESEDFKSCSVLITDKVRRTYKFLCSLARGIPIASVEWLNESKKADRFLDIQEYILSDPEAEAKFKFNLKESLDKARKNQLLEGYTIVLSSKIKQPPISELKDMVASSGGKALTRAPAKWPEKSVVITTEQDLESAKKLIAKAPKSVTVQSIEFILTGILRQETSFNEFKLLG